MRALQREKPCVLLIDELDKVDHAFEAQAFKRACSCFGLGRYLYHFSGAWVDLDERKRPKSIPRLFGWATPKGWRQGLRPGQEANNKPENPPSGADHRGNAAEPRRDESVEDTNALVVQIEPMAESLGRRLYRGILKAVARAWNPSDIHEVDVLRRVLEHMHAGERGLRRLEAALGKNGPEILAPVLRSLQLNSLDQVDSLDNLKKIVLEIERTVKMWPVEKASQAALSIDVRVVEGSLCKIYNRIGYLAYVDYS